jgi:transcription elongation GreA/GreB family factor
VRLWNEVGAPYEAALARMSLAEALRATGSENQAVLELQAARAILDRIEAVQTTETTAQVEREDEIDEEAAAALSIFRREGDHWSLVFEGRTVRVRDLKGMRYLARLLGQPGRELHVLDLVAAETGTTAQAENGRSARLSRAALGDTGAMLDAQAKEAYRRRLSEIEEDIDEARALGDIERAAQSDAERDFLVRELSRALGLGGRDRRAASASERARVAVTRAIRYAMARIGQHHPSLGEHLNLAIRTGTYCVYLPDPRAPAGWRF